MRIKKRTGKNGSDRYFLSQSLIADAKWQESLANMHRKIREKETGKEYVVYGAFVCGCGCGVFYSLREKENVCSSK